MADMDALRDAVTGWAAGGSGESAGELAEELDVRTAVLLEGPSDVAAVETLAADRGRDLASEGVCVLAMGGAMSIGRYAALLGPPGLGLRLVGLCDEAEKPFYDRGFDRAHASRAGLFVCTADLEDELVRALGVPRIEEIIHTEGDLRAWQTFVRQPAQQDRLPPQRMRRFLGTKKGRKIRYAHLLTKALTPTRVPTPLTSLLASL